LKSAQMCLMILETYADWQMTFLNNKMKG